MSTNSNQDVFGITKIIETKAVKNRYLFTRVELQKTQYDVEYPNGSEGGILLHVYCKTHNQQKLCNRRKQAEIMLHNPELFCVECLRLSAELIHQKRQGAPHA